jgi:uncharacterized membrane protein YedE/YeeE
MSDLPMTNPDAAKAVATEYSAANFLFALVFSGATFSLAIYNSGLYLVPIMQAQFTFASSIMLKTFLSAAATSTFAFTAIHWSGKNKRLLISEDKHKENNKNGLFALCMGGLTLGAGISVSGACPGTLPVQIGSGFLPEGLFTVLGAVLGASVFIALKPWMQKVQVLWDFTEGKKYRCTLDGWTGQSRISTGLFVTLVFAVSAGVTELLSPGMGKVNVSKDIASTLWSPFVCGPMIGSLQFPLMLSAGKHLGSSPAYMTTAKLIFGMFPCSPKRFRQRAALNDLWEFIYVLLSGIFAFMYAITLWTSRFPSKDGQFITPIEQIIGGFLILFGAKLAGGCTSGHGISGLGHLRMKSFVAVAAMFAGGIAVALVRGF